MPRLNVIILEKDGDDFRYALWADVPAARQIHYASSAKLSAWTGASSSDNAALQDGSVTETVSAQRVPSGATLPQIEAFLETRWNEYQTYINNFNPWQRYGSTWNSSTWVILNNG